MIVIRYLLDKHGDWTPFIENAQYQGVFSEELQQEMVVNINDDYKQQMEDKLKLKTY